MSSSAVLKCDNSINIRAKILKITSDTCNARIYQWLIFQNFWLENIGDIRVWIAAEAAPLLTPATLTRCNWANSSRKILKKIPMMDKTLKYLWEFFRNFWLENIRVINLETSGEWRALPAAALPTTPAITKPFNQAFIHLNGSWMEIHHFFLLRSEIKA